jgi:hypothetical protein
VLEVPITSALVEALRAALKPVQRQSQLETAWQSLGAGLAAGAGAAGEGAGSSDPARDEDPAAEEADEVNLTASSSPVEWRRSMRVVINTALCEIERLLDAHLDKGATSGIGGATGQDRFGGELISFLDALTSILSDECGETEDDTNARLRASAALVRRFGVARGDADASGAANGAVSCAVCLAMTPKHKTRVNKLAASLSELVSGESGVHEWVEPAERHLPTFNQLARCHATA